jgi:hypothetical protein
MFCGASHFDRDLSRWDIGRLPMRRTSKMFDGSSQSIERYIETGALLVPPPPLRLSESKVYSHSSYVSSVTDIRDMSFELLNSMEI